LAVWTAGFVWELLFFPVLPLSLDGLVAKVTLCGRSVDVHYKARKACFAPSAVSVNGVKLKGGRREKNRYRKDGLYFRQDLLTALLSSKDNAILAELSLLTLLPQSGASLYDLDPRRLALLAIRRDPDIQGTRLHDIVHVDVPERQLIPA
jgi:hypothetical protein